MTTSDCKIWVTLKASSYFLSVDLLDGVNQIVEDFKVYAIEFLGLDEQTIDTIKLSKIDFTINI